MEALVAVCCAGPAPIHGFSRTPASSAYSSGRRSQARYAVDFVPRGLHEEIASATIKGRPGESTADTPEGPRLTQRFEYLEEFLSQLETSQEEVRLQAASIVFTTEDPRPLVDRQNTFGGLGIIGPPATNMLFRPEEIHIVSGVGPVVVPARGRQVRLANHRFRRDEDRFIPHAQLEGLGAVEAAGIDLDILTGK